MSESGKVLLTYERMQQMEKELNDLKTTTRKEIAQKIKEARAQGDLSENAEYDAAKEQQGEIETRIAELEKLLRNAEIIDEDVLNNEQIQLGNRVKLLDIEFEEEIEYTKQAEKISERVLMVNSLSREPVSHGGTFDFKNGAIQNKLPYDVEDVLIVEL